ncbi:ankyrin repeat domain-containing protein [Lederbergia sp. NSJ-179]|uniref:ankyrin repeat domain-containing protein n=1 Tax=Lederbergia sp. NSJ-179 TaxID=2931402 RepID=UPI001FD56172|nr:ankyrin repeat domain-containing protein [Lederbergia sp. NSJ-179]MCJ7841970.1 ankyrin repeat domain-containing protein [Lederbergia sp. NSJ-179]
MSNSLKPVLVKDFVSNAHGDFEKVKELLEQEPGLINASWDWGNGDWETGLGAAAHMGRRDIAVFLIERGARIDLFSAAMLGKLDIVKAILSDNPELVHSKGPHTIPLIVHAKAGGNEAKPVLDYLESLISK